ncbi:MAG: metabolite traffic protein EboE [Planctomycetota bacterium]|jgi:sugar phosphate isomerase/epimerase
MRVQTAPALHLTYCLNVHPGESWAENLAAIRDEALCIRDRVARPGPFGLGLRLSAQAADELSQPAALSEFREFLAHEDLYVFTINGFPYGQFHDTAVKDNVYAPDWRTAERRDYTITMAEILAELLPKGVTGSISTVPCSYKPWIESDDDVRQMVQMLCDTAARLDEIRRDSGREIVLALEPEPDCYVETTDEVIAFFTGPLIDIGSGHLAERHSLSETAAADVIRRHLGVCFDTSHLAVEFEDLAGSLSLLKTAGVRVAKVHLSAALEATSSSAAREQLRQFCDPVYLHQVKARLADGRITSFADLPDALDAAGAGPAELWRIHFHVPLFFERAGELSSTNSLLTGEFAEALRSGATEHLEIETYTFGVLPPELQAGGLTESIAREYEWVFHELLGG